MLTNTIEFLYLYSMETKVIDTHPSLRNVDQRFNKTIESIVSSFRIEGISFSDEVLAEIVKKVEEEVRK